MMKRTIFLLGAPLVTLAAYATITTITFDATTDTNISSYTGGGSSWAYVLGTGGDVLVTADNDKAQCTRYTSDQKRVRYTGTGTTTGDQDVAADVQIKHFNSAGVLARCSAVADTCYQAWIDTTQTNEVRLDKIVAGTPTTLGSWDEGITPLSTANIRLRVTGAGEWEVQVNDGTVHTGTDSSSPLTSGHPGIYCSTDEGFTASIDNFVLDDLSDPDGLTLLYSDDFETLGVGSNPNGRGSGNFEFAGSAGVQGSSTQAHGGSRSVVFPWGPSGTQFAELEGDLGANYTRVKFKYWLRYPVGYVQQTSGTNYQGFNNKFVRLWPASSPGDATTSYGSEEKIGASTARLSGMSYPELYFEYDIGNTENGLAELGNSEELSAYVFPQSEHLGVWTPVELYFEAPTAAGQSNGARMRVTIGGVVRWDHQVNNWKPTQPHSYRYFYLLGTPNSGYDSDMPVYLDDLEVWVE